MSTILSIIDMTRLPCSKGPETEGPDQANQNQLVEHSDDRKWSAEAVARSYRYEDAASPCTGEDIALLSPQMLVVPHAMSPETGRNVTVNPSTLTHRSDLL